MLEHKIIRIKNIDIVVKTYSNEESDFEALLDALKKIDKVYGFELDIKQNIQFTVEPDIERNEEEARIQSETDIEANNTANIATAAE